MGFDASKCTYTPFYGSHDSAALLILPLFGLEPRSSPRVRGTIQAIRGELGTGALLYRYPPAREGLPGLEGAFLPCSFWLVKHSSPQAGPKKLQNCSSSYWRWPARSGSMARKWTHHPPAPSATTRNPSPT
jgi:GH15 family glucan-1,4-alpha-glucosidase